MSLREVADGSFEPKIDVVRDSFGRTAFVRDGTNMYSLSKRDGVTVFSAAVADSGDLPQLPDPKVLLLMKDALDDYDNTQ